MITIYSCAPDPATLDHKVLSSFFSTEQGNNGATFLHRKRSASTRGIVRLLFPKFLVKTKGNTGPQGQPRYQLKPDAFASFMFFVFVAASLIAVFAPADDDPYPFWQPLLFAGWYVFRAVIEIVRTKAAFDRATSGQPPPESDIVAQVTALLEAEQNETNGEV